MQFKCWLLYSWEGGGGQIQAGKSPVVPAPGGDCKGWMRGWGSAGRGKDWKIGCKLLTCPYTLMGSGCRAALRLLRSCFPSAPWVSPRANSRSSRASPCTTRKPRSWGKGERLPCSFCVQTSQRATGGSSATRVNRKKSRDSLLLLGVAMFRRTLLQVAPPPGENVQCEARRAAGPGPRTPLRVVPGRPRRSQSPRCACCLCSPPTRFARPGAVTCEAGSRFLLAHFLRSTASEATPAPPPPRDGEVKAASARDGASPSSSPRTHLLVHPAAVKSCAGRAHLLGG